MEIYEHLPRHAEERPLHQRVVPISHTPHLFIFC